MATFKTISSADIKTTTSTLNQLIDFVEEDVSGSLTRKKYKVFVTGTNPLSTVDPGVTSSIYQTVFDQDFSLQTSNELFDLTVGLFKSSASVVTASSGTDINGKKDINKFCIMFKLIYLLEISKKMIDKNPKE